MSGMNSPISLSNGKSTFIQLVTAAIMIIPLLADRAVSFVFPSEP